MASLRVIQQEFLEFGKCGLLYSDFPVTSFCELYAHWWPSELFSSLCTHIHLIILESGIPKTFGVSKTP